VGESGAEAERRSGISREPVRRYHGEMADASPHPTTLSRPTLWLSGSSVSRAPATTLSAD